MNPPPLDLESLRQEFARQNHDLQALSSAISGIDPTRVLEIAPQALAAIGDALEVAPMRSLAPLFPHHGTRA